MGGPGSGPRPGQKNRAGTGKGVGKRSMPTHHPARNKLNKGYSSWNHSNAGRAIKSYSIRRMNRDYKGLMKSLGIKKKK